MNTILFGGATIFSALFALWYVYSLCRGVVPFSKKAKEAKLRKAVLTEARTFVLSYEDLPAYSAGGEHGEAMQGLRAAWKARDAEKCFELLTELNPPQSWAACREWLDILVVSISVAMAFRAYFYEPFHIPTGSMQPTLYGNHSTPCKPEEATAWDKLPGLRWYKWLVTGKMYECYRAPFNGTLRFRNTNTGHYDMRIVNGVEGASKPMLVPTDVLHPSETGDGPYSYGVAMLPNGLHEGSAVLKGDLLWSGYVHSGDFLFVNRWLWNFRRPRRGDVMVFSTTGIPKLQQGTHYIKRMTGVPGEKLSIVSAGEKDGEPAFELRVNGEKPMTPRRVAQIQNHEKWHEKAYPYAGYRPSGRPDYAMPGRTLSVAGDEVTLGPDEFYACGDNSPSSYDSRYWGPVPAKCLVGIAGGVFWPFATHRWGPIE
jgi:signal peptidase I